MLQDCDIKSDFYQVTINYHVQIPARDGVLLSANLWLPQPRSPGERFPAILEMIPYRKDDWRYITDHQRMGYLAQRGYVCCRLDVRGTGSSLGVAYDEYTAAEIQDGYDVVEWLASQAWSNGNVGMWGISWGGFSAIQVAMLQPPHLKAIVPMYASDDRYSDDVHYIGGCMVVSEFAQYAASQIGMNAMPPSPNHFPANWQTLWRERLEATPPWVLTWLHNQCDNDYWRHGSLAVDYGRVQCAIFHIAGWHDGYVDCALRMHERCSAPRKTLIGPWVHTPPDAAEPGPNIDWLHEMVRFFDHWLKGVDNNVMAEPTMVAFRREYTQPGAFVENLNGEWLGIEGNSPISPSPNLQLFLHNSHLSTHAVTQPTTLPYPHRPTLGTHASLCWGGGAGPNGLGRDLRPDEALSLSFSSDPLSEDVDLFGFPEVLLYLQCDAPVAHVVVRLTDVAPDGTSAQVSAGVLNLSHRHDHRNPQPIDANEVMAIRLKLRAACYRFAAGHRIRVTIASAYWPVIWPSPFAGMNRLHCGSVTPSQINLPLLPTRQQTTPPAFKTTPPELIRLGEYQAEVPVWEIVEDVIAGSKTVHVYDGDAQTLPNGDVVFTSERLKMSASEVDPAEVTFGSDVIYRLQSGDERVAIRAAISIRSDQSTFYTEIDLKVTLNEAEFFQKSWQEAIRRELT